MSDLTPMADPGDQRWDVGLDDDFAFERSDTDIHTWFNLTYANYLVLPRSVLQSMPEEWQFRFTELLDEMQERYGHLDWPSYDVRALARPAEVIDHEECPECEGDGDVAVGFGIESMGTPSIEKCPSCDGEGEVEVDGGRYETPEEVGFRTDPIPHYNRGRTVIPPREEA